MLLPEVDMRRTVVALAAVLAAVPLIAQPPQGGAQSPQSGRRVAITIDDGPVVNEMSDLGNFQRITNGLIGSFQVEKVPVTIFVNEAQLNVPGQRDARAAVLDQWLDAGFELGNHAYSHRSANQVPFEQFADDVVKGEVIMRPLVERRGQKLHVVQVSVPSLGHDRRRASGDRGVPRVPQLSSRARDGGLCRLHFRRRLHARAPERQDRRGRAHQERATSSKSMSGSITPRRRRPRSTDARSRRFC